MLTGHRRQSDSKRQDAVAAGAAGHAGAGGRAGWVAVAGSTGPVIDREIGREIGRNATRC
jgi:hypothetical protein